MTRFARQVLACDGAWSQTRAAAEREVADFEAEVAKWKVEFRLLFSKCVTKVLCLVCVGLGWGRYGALSGIVCWCGGGSRTLLLNSLTNHTNTNTGPGRARRGWTHATTT